MTSHRTIHKAHFIYAGHEMISTPARIALDLSKTSLLSTSTYRSIRSYSTASTSKSIKTTPRPCLVMKTRGFGMRICAMATYDGAEKANLAEVYRHFLIAVSPNPKDPGGSMVKTIPEWEDQSQWIMAYPYPPRSRLRGFWDPDYKATKEDKATDPKCFRISDETYKALSIEIRNRRASWILKMESEGTRLRQDFQRAKPELRKKQQQTGNRKFEQGSFVRDSESHDQEGRSQISVDECEPSERNPKRKGSQDSTGATRIKPRIAKARRMSLIGSPLRSSRNSSLSSGRTVRLDHPTNEDGMGPQIQVHTENSLEEMTPRAPRARTRTQESTMEPVGEEEGVCQVESHDGEQTDAPEPGGLPPLDLTESLGTAESLALPLTTGPSVQAANSEVAALEAAASPAVLSKTKKKATVEKLMHQWYTAMTSAMK